MQLNSIVGVQEIPDMSGIVNGFEISVLRNKGEGFVVEKRDQLAVCAPTTPDKAMWLTKITSFLERWRGGDDGTRALHEASLKLLDEIQQQQQQHHYHSSSARSVLTQSSAGSPQRLLSRSPMMRKVGTTRELANSSK